MTNLESGDATGARLNDAEKAAQLIFSKNIQNILKKLKDGGTLTRAEQEIVSQFTAQQSAKASGGDDSTELMSRKDAAKVLKQDLKNLSRKVAAGKTLTATERALVQGLAEGIDESDAKAFAANQVELADALGVTRKSVQRWIKEGAPPAQSNGLWNVAEWRAWGKAKGKQFTEEDSGPSKAQQEARRLLLQNEKLEIELSIMRREYMHVDEFRVLISSLVAEARKILLAMPNSLPPQLAGLTEAQMSKRLRDEVDTIMFKLHAGAGYEEPPDEEEDDGDGTDSDANADETT
jgi:hypothetical protein